MLGIFLHGMNVMRVRLRLYRRQSSPLNSSFKLEAFNQHEFFLLIWKELFDYNFLNKSDHDQCTIVDQTISLFATPL